MAKPLKKFSKKILKSKTVIYLISWLIYFYAKFVKFTTKWHIEGLNDAFKLMDQKPIIAIIWHGRALMLPPFWKRNKSKMSALVSLHQDGRLIAGLLHRSGMNTIGGSTTNNATGSALNLLKSLKKSSSIAIIPDGPRGPGQVLNKSPIYFAQKTGAPIVFGTYSIKGSKIMKKSWDSMMIPRPFSKGILLISEPIYIPADLTEEETEKFRQEVEQKMNNQQNRADNYTETPLIAPGKTARKKRT
jgi:lysophospholipid acyltransferase (LPLAT)-like uncharacterized protein